MTVGHFTMENKASGVDFNCIPSHRAPRSSIGTVRLGTEK